MKKFGLCHATSWRKRTGGRHELTHTQVNNEKKERRKSNATFEKQDNDTW